MSMFSLGRSETIRQLTCYRAVHFPRDIIRMYASDKHRLSEEMINEYMDFFLEVVTEIQRLLKYYPNHEFAPFWLKAIDELDRALHS